MQSITPLDVVRKPLPHSEAVDTRGTDVTPPEDERPSLLQHQSSDLNQVNQEPGNERKSFKTPAVVLGDLTHSQQQLAMTMLEEEAGQFSQGDDDIGTNKGTSITPGVVRHYPSPENIRLNSPSTVC